MEISPPPKTPAKLQKWLSELVVLLRTLELSEGKGISIKIIKGKGTIISTIGLDVPDPPGSGTWILQSVNGAVSWVDTTTC